MPLDIFLTSRFGPAEAVAHARAAEAAGLGGVWLAEHHFVSYGQCPSSTLLAVHLLAATRRITIGTAACVLSARHPVALAEEAAMARTLGGDRFVLGVARGGPWIEVELLGGGADRYGRGFEESLDVLLGRLSGASPVGADGEFFRFPPLPVVPAVTGVPVSMAVTSLASAELAARRGLPLLLGVQADDAEVTGMVRRWREVAELSGHDPTAAEHARVRLAYPAKDRTTGERELREALPAWLAGMGEAVRIAGGPPPRDPRGHVEHMLRSHPVGRASDVAEQLADSAERTGVRRQICLVEAVPDAAAVTDLVGALGALPSQ